MISNNGLYEKPKMKKMLSGFVVAVTLIFVGLICGIMNGCDLNIESKSINDLSNVKTVSNTNYDKAGELLLKGDNISGVNQLKLAAADGLNNPFLFLRLSQEQTKRKRYSEALESNFKAIKILSSDRIEVVFTDELEMIGNERQEVFSSAFAQQGELYIYLQNIDNAKKSLEKALTHSPSNPKAIDLLGRIALSEMDYERAVKIYKEMVVQTPRFVMARYFLGKALIGSGDIDEGRKTLNQFIDLVPASHPAAIDAKKILKETG